MRVCCICGKPYEGHGNDARPVHKWGECCDVCNVLLVIPRRLRDAAIARIQRDADNLAVATERQKHASAKLNAFVGKPVIVTTWDGSTERGVLHIDTLATRLHSADAAHTDNTRVIGYYLDRGKQHGALHFKKSHISKIALDNIAPPLPAIYLCNGENTHCSKTNCVYSGGGCKYTTNIDYAVNAIKRTPSIITAEDTGDDVVYYDDEKYLVEHTEA